MSDRRTFATPGLCAVLILAGLILALVGQGWSDTIGWGTIAAALALAFAHAARHSPPARRVLRIALGGLLIAGLAALAWRQVERHDWGAIAWMFAHLGMYAIRIPHARRNRGATIAESRTDLSERTILAAMTLTMMVLPPIYLATDLFAFADYALPPAAIMLGVALLVPGLWLFRRSHIDLGRNWSVTLEVRETHALVTSGVYARIRHPMYSAIALLCLAQPLLLTNWIAGPPVLIALAALCAIRTPREEAMMRDRFGTEWDEYRRRSGRFLPRRG